MGKCYGSGQVFAFFCVKFTLFINILLITQRKHGFDLVFNDSMTEMLFSHLKINSAGIFENHVYWKSFIRKKNHS